ncbi:hypothetical protein IHV25_02555 [Phaeovibrio sulfidiphilus]|uniref:Lipoprotein n=1 Tax=Phaeovibrio sulfidiphilus TaxID=1220600 RepID=A0A8J6YXR4_9PROT|nr:hypothetical protein [Phaeovibrio sulfidiphilus]MBE1236533.1 hypothetical protein [Phaeovibrio sulfidiphilus]
MTARVRKALVAAAAVLALAGCTATRVPYRADWAPSDPWLDGPPGPMQTIDKNLSRLLLAVPPELDEGLGYRPAPAREVYVQKLRGGAILYSRYVAPAYLAASEDPARLVRTLYGPSLAQRTGAEYVDFSVIELPYGNAWLAEARGPSGVDCVAFVSPLRVGREAPAGASDALLRGSLCDTPDPQADLISILRSLVLRE